MALLNEINVKGVPHPIVTDDGYYEEMTVGDAEQLISTQFVEDNKPYLFRPTGGSHDVGNRAYLDKIVGGTVAWNQHFDFGTIVTTGGQIQANGAIDVYKDHVYLFIVDSSAEIAKSVARKGIHWEYGFLIPSSYGSNISYVRGRNYFINTCKETQTGIKPTIWYAISDVTLSNLMLIDLTQMFGSGNEPTLEECKQIFSADYYEYNAGELLSVEGLQSHDTVGFNQWDGTSENGRWISDYTTGAVAPASNTYNVTNLIRVLPNTAYYHSQTDSSRIIFYDSEKNAIPMSGWQYSDGAGVITTPQNARYVRFTVTNSCLSTFCINLNSPSRNGEYEPYEKHSYPLDNSLTLRGIPKLDASNNLYYDGDEYTSDGKVKRKYGVVDLGTIDWEQGGSNNRTSWVPKSWKTNVKPVEGNDTKANILCNKYYTDTAAHVETQVNDKTISVNVGSWVYIYDNAYISVTPQEFKAAMSGVMLVYELATSTTETAEPFQNIQIVDDFGTEEFVSTGIVPVGHKTRYTANLRDKLQHLPSLAGMDGCYTIRQTNKQMHLELFKIPKAPTTDGTYVLKADVSGGTPTYVWEGVNAESEGE